MMVSLTNGKCSAIQPAHLIFKSHARYYHIRGILDNLPGVNYGSSAKGGMDSTVWKQWLTEPKEIPIQSRLASKTLHVDKYTSHPENEDLSKSLNQLRTGLKKLLPNETAFVQPVDSFVIQKMNKYWLSNQER